MPAAGGLLGGGQRVARGFEGSTSAAEGEPRGYVRGTDMAAMAYVVMHLLL